MEKVPPMNPRLEKLLRPKRLNFQYVEEGVCSRSQQPELFKFTRKLEARAKELKAKQAQMTKAKAEYRNLIELSERVIIKEKPMHLIPDEAEWWDILLLPSGNYGGISSGGNSITEDKLKMENITMYVEHPMPIEPTGEPVPPPPQLLDLPKKERKRLRTQWRIAKERDTQERINNMINNNLHTS